MYEGIQLAVSYLNVSFLGTSSKKYKKLKLYKIILYLLFVGLNLALVTEGRSQIGSVQEESMQ
jgi:hypothetical protein